MRTRSLFGFAAVLLVSLLVLWGCPKKAEVTGTPEARGESAPAAQEMAKTEEKAEAMKAAAEPERREGLQERAAAASGGLQPIYFEFDKSFIRDDARSVLKANADWLRANPAVKIRIEGNCDERGTAEYNQALGQRRAVSAKKFLTDIGIAENRIKLLSYGKEKPVCTDHAEDCWQKNRRDDFIAVRE